MTACNAAKRQYVCNIMIQVFCNEMTVCNVRTFFNIRTVYNVIIILFGR